MLIAGLALCSAVFQLHAAPIFYDSFNYSPPGAQLQTAGSPDWIVRVAGEDPKINAGSLNYPGLQTAVGDNSVIFNGVGPAAGVSGRVLDQTYNISNATTVYYSLTFQVSSILTGDWGGTGNWQTGSFMMGFSQAGSGGLTNPGVGAPLPIRTGDPTNASGMADNFQEFQLGTGVTAVSPGSRVFDGTRNYLPGQTLFLVLAYTFGPNTLDDVARLWVNPIPGSAEGANTPVVIATGVTDVLNNQLASFFLRNNSVEPASTIVDDLRVGTTWEDVTPVPEPSAFAVIVLGAGALLLRRARRLTTAAA